MGADRSLELVVDPGRVALADSFFRAGVGLLELLDEVTEEPAEWVISGLRTGSAVAVIAPTTSTQETDRVLLSIVGGLQAVSRGGEVPADWSPNAIGAARRLARTVGDREFVGRGHLRLIQTTGGDDTAPLTAELADRLDTLQPFTRTMPGAIRGRLVGLNVSRGNRASLRPARGRIVKLSFPSELRWRLKEAMLDQVEVRGQVSQDVDGHIFHVRVEDLQHIGEPQMRWTDLFGYDPDITHGLPVSEYLEGIRGEA